MYNFNFWLDQVTQILNVSNTSPILFVFDIYNLSSVCTRVFHWGFYKCRTYWINNETKICNYVLSTHFKKHKKRDNHSVWISFKGKNSIWKHSGYRMDIWGNFYFQKIGHWEKRKEWVQHNNQNEKTNIHYSISKCRKGGNCV